MSDSSSNTGCGGFFMFGLLMFTFVALVFDDHRVDKLQREMANVRCVMHHVPPPVVCKP